MTGLDVRPLARLISEPLVLVDVGVRWGFPPRWETLVPAARLLGFDPDAAECSRLRERYRDQPEVRIEALALGESAGDAQLHIARDPGSSSLLQAAKSSRESVQSVGSVRVPVERLDDWAARHELQRADVLKLDAQGAELAVLRGSPRLLRTAFAVQLEVEFSMLYVGQPLFGDVDAHMRDAGFALWRLDDLHHEPATTVAAAPLVRERRTYGDRTVETPGPGGRLVWGEATYVRVDSTPQAALAAWAVGLDDLATGIVAELAKLGPGRSPPRR